MTIHAASGAIAELGSIVALPPYGLGHSGPKVVPALASTESFEEAGRVSMQNTSDLPASVCLPFIDARNLLCTKQSHKLTIQTTVIDPLADPSSGFQASIQVVQVPRKCCIEVEDSHVNILSADNVTTDASSMEGPSPLAADECHHGDGDGMDAETNEGSEGSDDEDNNIVDNSAASLSNGLGQLMMKACNHDYSLAPSIEEARKALLDLHCLLSNNLIENQRF